MTSAMSRSSWQSQFITELREIARAMPELVTIRAQRKRTDAGEVPITLALTTFAMRRGEGGLLLHPVEEVEVVIPRSIFHPPSVSVTHSRFVGYPHVSQGHVLCIYLDVYREWDPSQGARGFLNRLSGWFASATAGRFNAHTALFHAVGGTAHDAGQAATVVFRDEMEAPHTHGALLPRSNNRFDFSAAADAGGVRVPVWVSSSPLPLGTGTTIAELAAMLDDPTWVRRGAATSIGSRTPALWMTLQASASRNESGTAQPFVLLVPHPAGGPPHLMAGSIAPNHADALRAGAAPDDVKIDWWRVSDERRSVTTRRDSTRPTRAFEGKNIALFGAGGLGSWLADFIVRAGVARLILADPGRVSGGLLVRQNFLEDDIGALKRDALRTRLTAIDDDVHIDTLEELDELDLNQLDLVIDASINLAVGQVLSVIADDVLTAQIAVDPATSGRGMILVKSPSSGVPLQELDRAAGQIVMARPDLEDYHVFWSGSDQNTLTPTRGCSVPTFHGSAADMAASAGVIASLLGGQLVQPAVGLHLFSLPHVASPGSPGASFIALA